MIWKSLNSASAFLYIVNMERKKHHLLKMAHAYLECTPHRAPILSLPKFVKKNISRFLLIIIIHSFRSFRYKKARRIISLSVPPVASCATQIPKSFFKQQAWNSTRCFLFALNIFVIQNSFVPYVIAQFPHFSLPPSLYALPEFSIHTTATNQRQPYFTPAPAGCGRN